MAAADPPGTASPGGHPAQGWAGLGGPLASAGPQLMPWRRPGPGLSRRAHAQPASWLASSQLRPAGWVPQSDP